MFESRRPDHPALAQRGQPAVRRVVRIGENVLARIYRPSRTAMQAGTALTRRWVLEFEPQSPRQIEPLMGWTSSDDMLQQVRLEFDTREEAVAYANKHGIACQVFEPHDSRPKPRAYSDNFRFDRKEPWTH